MARFNYRNVPKIKVNGITFDSKSEYNYYMILKDLEARGHISEFKLQHPRFTYPQLKHASDRDGWYTPDFWVKDSYGREHIVEIKGVLEDAARIKMSFIEYLYGIDIKVVPTRNGKKNRKWTYSAMDTSFITEKPID